MMTRHPYTRPPFILLIICLFVMPAFAQQSGGTYTARDGAFTVTLPAGWTTENIPVGVEFNSPEGVTMYWVALPAEDADSAALEAIALFTPGFAGMPVQRSEFAAPQGVWVQQLYLVRGQLAASLSLMAGETAYVLWVPPADQALVAAVSPPINEMLISLTYPNMRDATNAEVFTLEQDALDLLDEYIAGALERFEMPGAVVAVVQNGGVIFTGAYGVADRESGTPVTPDTRFMIGSTTKSMTSWAAASLIDDGLFGWDTPITEVLPGFTLSNPEAAAQLTVRDFFSMSSGLPRYDIAMFLQRLTPPELLADVATFPLVAAPGEQFNYNNQMVALGGFAIAAYAAGAPFDDAGALYTDLIAERLFAPLGMTHSTVDFDEALATGLTATPYYIDFIDLEFKPADLNYERFVMPVAPAGSVWSTAGDMGLYLAAHMRNGAAEDGTPIVSAENLAVTKTGVVSAPGMGEYALGWIVGDWYGQPMLQHGGATAGFSSTFAYLPEAGIGVVVLTNRAGGDHFGAAVRDYVFELAFSLPNESEARHVAAQRNLVEIFTALRQQAAFRLVAADAEAIAPFLGQYERGVTLSLDEAGMAIMSGDFGEITLYPSGSSGTQFVTSGVLGGLIMSFSQAADGTASVSMMNPLSALTENEPEITLLKLG